MSQQPFMPPKEADVQKIISQYGADPNVMQAMTLLRVGAVEHYLEDQNGRVRDNCAALIKVEAEQKNQHIALRDMGAIGIEGGRRRSDPDSVADKAALKVLTINLNRTHLNVAIVLGILAITAEVLLRIFVV